MAPEPAHEAPSQLRALVDIEQELAPDTLDQSHWTDLVSASVALRESVERADALLKAERQERLAELKERVERAKALEARLEQVRGHLKARAVANYVSHHAMGKTFGGVQLREQHRMVVDDLDQAVNLLAGFVVMDRDDQPHPLVVWKPTLDPWAVEQLIRYLESDPALWPVPVIQTEDGTFGRAGETFDLTARGWPGAVRLTRRDDLGAYILVVERDKE